MAWQAPAIETITVTAEICTRLKPLVTDGTAEALGLEAPLLVGRGTSVRLQLWPVDDQSTRAPFVSHNNLELQG